MLTAVQAGRDPNSKLVFVEYGWQVQHLQKQIVLLYFQSLVDSFLRHALKCQS